MSSQSVQLPEPQPFIQAARHENGWSDHYGALQVASAYAGVDLPERYVIKGLWQHGVFGPWQHFSPGILVYNAPGAQQRPVFVARTDEAEVLRKHGYQDVRAIGMPIAYVPAPTVERIPGSLLVVPTHSLRGDKHEDRTLFERYAQLIKGVAGHFAKVTVCIHPNCQQNGLWVKEFTELGLEIVYGAQTSDANALRRMRSLFAQFETITTNDWGSHVAYALAFGARVAIAGQPIAGDPALHARDEMWKNDREAMTKAFSAEISEQRREFLKRFHVSPLDAVADHELGRWFIGWDRRLTPAEMRAALTQLIVPREATANEIAEKRREQRRLVRVESAQLVAKRRKADALQVLLRFVQQAAETKDPLFILETLAELARDLQPLDPERAAVLLAQARVLATRIETARRTAA